MSDDEKFEVCYERSAPKFNPKHDGCEYAKTCLACPLPRCKEELSAGARVKLKTRWADLQTWELMQAENLTPAQVAKKKNLGVRAVYRMLERIKGEDIGAIFSECPEL